MGEPEGDIQEPQDPYGEISPSTQFPSWWTNVHSDAVKDMQRIKVAETAGKSLRCSMCSQVPLAMKNAAKHPFWCLRWDGDTVKSDVDPGRECCWFAQLPHEQQLLLL